MAENNTIKQTWKRSYTWVLIANAIYIILFYIIMKAF
ncbi:hypothetical protein J2Z57_001991 [Formosa algae]|uniref:Uncharacterized protein n=1 Tax=Formosa algae TaxID=225843 RepID=A0A9X1CCA2_9FLAO|nr:hypothetical protein [Formosa algae]MDQ0335543.1 hypothetical protein [Formosa algae]